MFLIILAWIAIVIPSLFLTILAWIAIVIPSLIVIFAVLAVLTDSFEAWGPLIVLTAIAVLVASFVWGIRYLNSHGNTHPPQKPAIVLEKSSTSE